jgi:hypothetical protein
MHSGRLERAGDDFVLEEDGVPKEPSHLNKNRHKRPIASRSSGV